MVTRPRRSGPAPKAPTPPSRYVYRRAQGTMAPRNQSGNRPPEAGPEACPIKSQCGTCTYVNQNYQTGLRQKFEHGRKVLDEAGVTGRGVRVLDPVPSPRELEYRSHFKLAVRPFESAVRIHKPRDFRAPPVSKTEADTPRRFVIGLFRQGTHDVVSMEDCPLHTWPLRRLIRDLQAELDASSLTPYNEEAHSGQIRYVAARAAHLTGELIVTFVAMEPLKNELKNIVLSLRRRGHKVNSAYVNVNTERGNAIFGGETIRIAGSDRLRERLCDLDFEVGPVSFFQINPWQAIQLYRRIEQIAGRVDPDRRSVAWDLYCGTGQISLILARQGYKVLGVEEIPSAVEDARINAQRNRLEKAAEFIASRVEDSAGNFPEWSDNPGLVVVNPSRRGLAASAAEHLAGLLKTHPRMMLIYVSCEVETLARDLKILAASGVPVRQIEAFDMFPQTNNMEWLAVLAP